MSNIAELAFVYVYVYVAFTLVCRRAERRSSSIQKPRLRLIKELGGILACRHASTTLVPGPFMCD